MSRVRSFGLTFALALSACTFLDPLDDVSGGAKSSGPEPAARIETDAGEPPAQPADSGTDSAAPAPAKPADCLPEQEPNDSFATAQVLAKGSAICGTVTPTDEDDFKLTLAANEQLVITVSADAPISFLLQGAGRQITAQPGPGSPLTSTTSGQGGDVFIRMTTTSARASYRIERR